MSRRPTQKQVALVLWWLCLVTVIPLVALASLARAYAFYSRSAVDPDTAILDRFLHHADIINITGKSYRLNSSVRERGGSKKKEEAK